MPTPTSSDAAAAGAIKVNIATPSYNDSFSGEYLNSMFRLIYAGRRRGADFSFSKVSYADIEVARNYLISNFYYNKTDCGHVLFIDDDMGFDDRMIFEMLDLGKPVVGALCPKRSLSLKALHESGALPLDQAVAKATGFVGKLASPKQTLDGFVRMDWCGSGILLVSREGVAQMIEAIPGIVDHSLGEFFGAKIPQTILAFDKIKDGGRHYSEDVSFCKRWIEQCGGEIWAAREHAISHVGRFTFRGRHSDLP